ncbi:MAG: NADH-quinone oxidoreductase subunit NuoG [Buchnera aphidicola (Eriosoma harunire)]
MIIVVDGKKYELHNTRHLNNLLHACLSIGINIPYFCWHPALGSVGSCRQCAVKLYQGKDDQKGRLVMSCMTSVIDNLILSVQDQEVVAFRKNISELLMINHPHDCPVCDEGGNCHLQDMIVMNGYVNRRYRFSKRTHLNQYLGPFISHNMNRCISCYRCIRFYKNYADGTDFGVYGVSSNLYFGRVESGCLENEYSGNLIEVCPTGVFTDKSNFQNYSRKWDMQYGPSVCQHCSIGCNISVGERGGFIRKIENRYHRSINNYFLCDRGRFSYGFSNVKNRPQKIHIFNKDLDYTSNISCDQILISIIDKMKDSDRVIGIGSSRASMESNYSLQKLVGQSNFSNGMTTVENNCIQTSLNILQNCGIKNPSLKEIEDYDAIVVFGEDLVQTSPCVALAVRQAVKKYSVHLSMSKGIDSWNSMGIFNIENQEKYPLFITHVDETKLDDVAVFNYKAPIINQVQFVMSIANTLDPKCPGVVGVLNSVVVKLVTNVVNVLLNSKKPLVISGSHSGSQLLIQSAFNVALSLSKRGIDVGMLLLPSSVNSYGVGLISNISIEDILNQLDFSKKNTIIVLEHDLYRSLRRSQVNFIFKHSDTIIIDHQNTDTYQHGKIGLPSTNFFESSGTVINNELRSQRFFQVYVPSFYRSKLVLFDSWYWLNMIRCKIYDNAISWYSLDNIIDALILDFPFLKNIKKSAPDSSFRISGQKIARSPHRFSGRTSFFSSISVHEPSQPKDIHTMFSFSMEGSAQLHKSSGLIPFAWFPGLNSSQLYHRCNDVHDVNTNNIDVNSGLININKSKNMQYFSNVCDRIVKQSDWVVVPYYYFFGSDELSQYSDIIKTHKSVFPAFINVNEADKLTLSAGDMICFYFLKEKFSLFVQYSNFLQDGHIGIPIGTPGVPLCLLGQIVNGVSKDKI